MYVSTPKGFQLTKFQKLVSTSRNDNLGSSETTIETLLKAYTQPLFRNLQNGFLPARQVYFPCHIPVAFENPCWPPGSFSSYSHILVMPFKVHASLQAIFSSPTPLLCYLPGCCSLQASLLQESHSISIITANLPPHPHQSCLSYR